MAKVSTSTAPASSATASSSILTATPNTHEAVVQIGLELGVVAITAVIAGTGAKATHAMVALWFLILVLLLVTHYHTTGTVTQSTTFSTLKT